MRRKQLVLVLVFIAVFASVSLVAANQAGVFTLNIFNSPQSQLQTNISNSTIEGNTNYTNSQAIENISLSNSTLTLNVNGQIITVTDQNGNLTINAPTATNPTPTPTPSATATATPNPTPTPKPLVTVTYLTSRQNPGGMVSGNATMYDFTVIVSVPTSFNFPWGENVTHQKLGQALIPLISQYSLVTNNYNGFTTATWQNMIIVDGKSTFSLWSTNPLTENQIAALTADLQEMFTAVMQ